MADTAGETTPTRRHAALTGRSSKFTDARNAAAKSASSSLQTHCCPSNCQCGATGELEMIKRQGSGEVQGGGGGGPWALLQLMHQLRGLGVAEVFAFKTYWQQACVKRS